MKKLLSVLLAAALFISCAALPAAAESAGFALELPENEQVCAVKAAQGALYLAARAAEPGAPPDPDYQPDRADRLYRAELSGGEPALIYSQEDASIADFAVCADGSVWLCQASDYVGADGMTVEQSYLLRRIDRQGGELARADLSLLPAAAGMYLRAMAARPDGGVIALLSGYERQSIALVSPEGEPVSAQIQADGQLSDLCPLEDGALAGLADYTSLTLLDPESLVCASRPLSGIEGLGDYILRPLCGDGDTVWLLLRNTMLLSCQRDSGELTERMSLLDLGVDSLAAAFLLDGAIWGVSCEPAYTGVRAFPIPLDGDSRTCLTIASFSADSVLQAAIAAFNRAETDFRVELRPYGQYDDPLTRFLNDVIAGDVPDMVQLGDMPYDTLLDQGLLADLTPYIDADPDIRKEDYVNCMWSAVTVDGGIYSLISWFLVQTCWGLAGELEAADFTLDRFEREAASGRAILQGADSPDIRNYFFQCLLAADLDQFVDMDSAACSFDSPAFTALLEAVGTMTIAPEQDQSARPLVWERGGLASSFIQPGLTLLGWPTPAGGAFLLEPAQELAMTTRARDPEACWRFLRSFLLDAVQSDETMACFPAQRKALDARKAQFPGEDTSLADAVLDGAMLPVREGSRRAAISQIVCEQAAAYFSGASDAQATAAAIQNRMRLYLAEQG